MKFPVRKIIILIPSTFYTKIEFFFYSSRDTHLCWLYIIIVIMIIIYYQNIINISPVVVLVYCYLLQLQYKLIVSKADGL